MLNTSRSPVIHRGQTRRAAHSPPVDSTPKEILNITDEIFGYIRVHPMTGMSQRPNLGARK